MLTSLDQIKTFLNISSSDTSQDRQLSGLQVAAESLIQSRIKRNLEPASYTEYYAGNSQRALVLRNRPVLSIESIYEDYKGYSGYAPDCFGPETLLTSGHHYTLDVDTGTTTSKSGLVIRIGGVWMEVGRVYFPGKLSAEIGPTFGNLKITYTAGFDVIPSEIEYAVCLTVASMRRNISTGGTVISEKIGDYEYKLSDSANNSSDPLIASVQQILSHYTEMGL